MVKHKYRKHRYHYHWMPTTAPILTKAKVFRMARPLPMLKGFGIHRSTTLFQEKIMMVDHIPLVTFTSLLLKKLLIKQHTSAGAECRARGHVRLTRPVYPRRPGRRASGVLEGGPTPMLSVLGRATSAQRKKSNTGPSVLGGARGLSAQQRGTSARSI